MAECKYTLVLGFSRMGQHLVKYRCELRNITMVAFLDHNIRYIITEEMEVRFLDHNITYTITGKIKRGTYRKLIVTNSPRVMSRVPRIIYVLYIAITNC